MTFSSWRSVSASSPIFRCSSSIIRNLLDPSTGRPQKKPRRSRKGRRPGRSTAPIAIMEAAGIEPASASPSATASTCVVRDQVSSREGSRTTPPRNQPCTRLSPCSRHPRLTARLGDQPDSSTSVGRSSGPDLSGTGYAEFTQPEPNRRWHLKGFPVFNEAPGTSARFRGFRFTRRSRVAPLILAKAAPYGGLSRRAAQVPGAASGDSLTAGNRRGYTRSLPGPADVGSR